MNGLAGGGEEGGGREELGKGREQEEAGGTQPKLTFESSQVGNAAVPRYWKRTTAVNTILIGPNRQFFFIIGFPCHPPCHPPPGPPLQNLNSKNDLNIITFQ